MKQSTEELKNEITASDSLENWSEDKKDSIDEITLAEYLKRMLEIHNISKINVISNAQLDTTYGYQIFQGKKHPSRDILLKIAFGFPLTVDETNHLMWVHYIPASKEMPILCLHYTRNIPLYKLTIIYMNTTKGRSQFSVLLFIKINPFKQIYLS